MRGTWVALLVAGVVALGACGGSASSAKSDGKDQPGLAEMLGATEKANTARFDLHMQMSGGFTSGIDERANGVMDFAKNRGSASMSAQKPAGNETDSAPVEVRWLDGKEYERYDPNANNSDEPVTAAKPWVLTENDGACAGNDSNGFLGAMLGMPGLQTGPGNVLSELADRGVAMVRIGTETVRGTDTTHWRAEIPKAATTTTLDGSDDCGDTLGGASPKVEIWTDNENRVRRITMSAAAAEPGGVPISMSATTELYDYGVNVDVSAPPADQIAQGDSVIVSGPNSGLSTSSGVPSHP